MYCLHCGRELDDTALFCEGCGRDLPPPEAPATAPAAPPLEQAPPLAVSAAAMPSASWGAIPEASATPPVLNTIGAPPMPPGSMPPPEPPAKKPKNKVKWLVAAGIALVILATAVAVPLIIHNQRQTRYDDAVALMDDGDFQTAADEFDALKNFDDSTDLAYFCRQSMDYLAAKEEMDNGDYTAAKKAFGALDDFKDARRLKAECENALAYQDAAALLEEGSYSEAQSLFEGLGEYKDAPEQAQLCRNKLSYIKAEEAFAQELYYTAYLGFDLLGDFEDAVQRRDACVQTFPGAGELYHNDAYVSWACSLEVRPPAADYSCNYLKIYAEDGTLVSIIAVSAGQRATISVPAGRYQIRTAYSFGNWYGEKEMFGDEGYYEVLTFDSDGTDVMDFVYNHIYTLTLREASYNSGGDSVNTYDKDREDF